MNHSNSLCKETTDISNLSIAIVHNYLSDNDGSSVALHGLIRLLNLKKYIIITKKYEGTIFKNVFVANSYEDIDKIFKNNIIDIIHNFRLLGYDLFKWVIKAIHKYNLSPKIITTINQRPSFPQSLLSIKELKYSDKFVFIDNTALKDPLYNFIPLYDKELIYYTVQNFDFYDKYYIKRINYLKNKKNDDIIFARGSSLIKCPPDMIENFNLIDYEKKIFKIFGINQNTWVGEAAKRQSNIEIFPILPLEDWLNALSETDIFLYQIPEDAYSSLDGTLGSAMLLGIPVVYYGAEAPKERFIHGVNGFIANTKEEISKYATMLAKDSKLRESIGLKGRESIFKKFSNKITKEKYLKLYLNPIDKKNFRIPFNYYIYFFLRNKYWYYYVPKRKRFITILIKIKKAIFNFK